MTRGKRGLSRLYTRETPQFHYFLGDFGIANESAFPSRIAPSCKNDQFNYLNEIMLASTFFVKIDIGKLIFDRENGVRC